jgi:hypothetical protein
MHLSRWGLLRDWHSKLKTQEHLVDSMIRMSRMPRYWDALDLRNMKIVSTEVFPRMIRIESSK